MTFGPGEVSVETSCFLKRALLCISLNLYSCCRCQYTIDSYFVLDRISVGEQSRRGSWATFFSLSAASVECQLDRVSQVLLILTTYGYRTSRMLKSEEGDIVTRD